MIKLEKIKKRALLDLDLLINQIKQFENKNKWISREFYLTDDLAQLVKDIANENENRSFLYIFTTDSPNLIYSKYKLFDSKSLKISKVNDYKENKTKCLYVGSGRNCRSRLSQHLGITIKSNGTYSLHLKKVLGSKADKAKFSIYVLSLGNDVDQLLMQSLEDSLWKMLSPCFGKVGGR